MDDQPEFTTEFLDFSWLESTATESGDGASPVSSDGRKQNERIAMMREIRYETTRVVGEDGNVNPDDHTGESAKALSLNISSGGMLLVMKSAPEVEQVFRIHVPTPVRVAFTPTLAEVRWTRRLPFDATDGTFFVGLKFLF